MALFLKYIVVFVVGGLIVTQLILPPFIGKEFFWMFKSKTKQSTDQLTVSELRDVISEAKSKLNGLKSDFKKDLKQSEKEKRELEKLISETEKQIGKIS